MIDKYHMPCTLLLLVLLLARAWPACALPPEELVVIANSRVKGSRELAVTYMTKRNIPGSNLVVLDTSASEAISRAAYVQEIRNPVREFLRSRRNAPRISCLVTVYGVPLKIRPAAGEKESPTMSAAAVDSELALVLVDDYPLEGWVANPYFAGFQGKQTPLSRDQVLLVSRLDGPDLQAAARLVDDAMATEKKGLQGRACFDARWPMPASDHNLDAYKTYDLAIHHAARLVAASGRMEVKTDDRSELFQPGDCPDTALYCGWYSLGRYVDAFSWARGAVGYHIASAECSTLHAADSRVWCRQMLARGVTATLGPVYEPYLRAFPPPDLFFATLIQGYLSLGETYLVSLPYLSWQMILVGDPLYQPFLPENKEKNLEKITNPP
jgi:uncharacterized protein (TIGR03790 family)